MLSESRRRITIILMNNSNNKYNSNNDNNDNIMIIIMITISYGDRDGAATVNARWKRITARPTRRSAKAKGSDAKARR